jgi:hypothetical protein
LQARTTAVQALLSVARSGVAGKDSWRPACEATLDSQCGVAGRFIAFGTKARGDGERNGVGRSEERPNASGISQ